MEDIKRVQLSEIAGLITKGTTPTTLGYEFQEDGVNFLKIECFDENGGFIESKVAHISEECNEKLKRSQLKAGDVLFSIAGAIGRVAIVTEEMLPANTNQALAIIRIADEQVYLPYIKLILTSPIVIEQFEKKKQGVAQLNLSLKDINEISIPLPSKEKQIELAELFDKVAGVIAKRKTEISALDDLIKARFVELFGDPVSDTKSWGIKPLKENLVSVRYGASQPPQFTDAGYAFIRATNIKNGRIINNDMKYIPQAEADRLEKCRLSGGELIIVRSGVNAGDTCVVTDEYKGQYAGYDMILVLKDSINPVFLNTLINTSYMEKVVKPMTRRAAQPHLNAEQVQSFPIIMAPYELQIQFADFVKQVDKSKVMKPRDLLVS